LFSAYLLPVSLHRFMYGCNEIAAVGVHGCGDRIGNRHGSAADALHTAKRAAGQEN